MPTPHDPERLLREKQKRILLCSGLAGEIQQVAQGITLARETVELQTRDALPDSYAQYIGPALGDMDVCVRYLTYIAENLSDLTSQSQGQLTPRLQPVEPAWQWTQLIGLVSESTPGGRRVVWECGCPEGQFVLRAGEISAVYDTADGAGISELVKRIPADMKEFAAKKAQYELMCRSYKEQLARQAFEEELSSQCQLLPEYRR